MSVKNSMAAALAVFLCLGISIHAHAEVPTTMTYHGKLTDGSGQPLDITVEAAFRLYNAESGGNEVWSESALTVDVVGGSFTTQLGASQSLADVFDGASYWLEVSINGETLSPRTPVESVPYALRAKRANDANTLQGQSASELTASVAVPTRAAELTYDNASSGLVSTDIQAALDELAQLRARIEALEANAADTSLADRVSQNETAISTLENRVDTNVTTIAANADLITANASAIGANAALITTNQSDIATQASEITALQNLTQNMERETINGHPALTFTGVNLHVRNGLGSTHGNSGNGPEVNGLGNLIVGYDEARAVESDKSGSHNLIVGGQHNYPSYGGFVAGHHNSINGGTSSVSGGQNNTAHGGTSSVSGGFGNTAHGGYSSVSGGGSNIAVGQMSSVSGGEKNVAMGVRSSVSGGEYNYAIGNFSSVSGGSGNEAAGESSSISGGQVNTAEGDRSSVSGGLIRRASGENNWVAGSLFESN